MDHNTITEILNFLSTRSPLEYTAITGWAVSEVLGLAKNTKIKSVLGAVIAYGKAIWKAVRQVEVFVQSDQGKAIIAEVQKDLTKPPAT